MPGPADWRSQTTRFINAYPEWLCLLAGALIPLSLAPFDCWLVAPVSACVLALAIHKPKPGPVFLRCWLFGLGLFGVGASWVFISIHEHGYAPVPLATLLTALFIMGLALAFALPFFLYAFLCSKKPSDHYYLLAIFPALWVLGEWSRSWLLTGFPWLYLGYGHLTSPLAGWYPVTGIYGVSWIVVLSAGCLASCLLQKTYKTLLLPLVFLVAGAALNSVQWTQVQTHPIATAIVQPIFSLETKWDKNSQRWIKTTLDNMTTPYLADSDLILWPEAAIPQLYQDVTPFLEKMHHKSVDSNTALITGIPYYNHPQSLVEQKAVFHNSIIAIGNGSGVYHKVRLVPFGEYVPLEKWLRGLIHFFDLPMSQFSKGPEQQQTLKAADFSVAPFICYEIVYPDLVARNSRNADFLVTISNDSWFGDSLGPLQHLQMAQVRAAETGRYLIRGTNDGISAIINPKGKILKRTERFVAQTARGTVYATRGDTPFMLTGSLPVLLPLILLLLLPIFKSTFSRT